MRAFATSTTISSSYPAVVADRTKEQQVFRTTKHALFSTRSETGKVVEEEEQKGTIPSLEVAKTMPKRYSSMDNQTLVMLGAMGIHGARAEILKRHIMATDDIDYHQATSIFRQIESMNVQGLYYLKLPYRLGYATALITGVVVVPLVFHLPSIELFNQYMVTAEIPSDRNLETPLEASIWAWKWMAPFIGTSSFVLLCFNQMRAQLQLLGVKEYLAQRKRSHGIRLSRAFPRYDPQLIADFCETATEYNKHQHQHHYDSYQTAVAAAAASTTKTTAASTTTTTATTTSNASRSSSSS